MIKLSFKRLNKKILHSDNSRDAENVSTKVVHEVPNVNQQQSNEPAETAARLNMFTIFSFRRIHDLRT